ncbi:MAG: FxsA family protein [Myxococcales bacterium]|nr:FxsA family protein [Myxococcales bacterium]
MSRLLLLFTAVPLVELLLLTWVSERIGFANTVLMVLVTGALGAAMARAEGLRVLRSWQQSLAQGQLPEDGVIGGLLVLVGGVLLVTPGVLTDAVGLLLLLPTSRRTVARVIAARLQRAIEEGRIQVVGSAQPGGFGDFGGFSGFSGRGASSAPAHRPPRVVEAEVIRSKTRTS